MYEGLGFTRLASNTVPKYRTSIKKQTLSGFGDDTSPSFLDTLAAQTKNLEAIAKSGSTIASDVSNIGRRQTSTPVIIPKTVGTVSSNTWLYVGLGAVALLGTTLVVMVVRRRRKARG